MKRIGLAGRAGAGLVAISLVAACAVGASPLPSARTTPAAEPSSTAAPASRPTLPQSPEVSPSASPTAVVEALDIPYEVLDPSEAPDARQPGLLDVYAPSAAGTWPVAVMLHGSPPTNTKTTWSSRARDLAAHGFVVFVPTWGRAVLTSSLYDVLGAAEAEVACAVAFAGSHAAAYGGDPATMIVFGHSAGANMASMVAFARPAPTSGCVGATTLGPIHALVTWDGDWMMEDPTWDDALAADARLLDRYTPLTYVAEHRDLPVVMLRSKVAGGYVRYLEDPATLAGFFAIRDPTGSLREQVESLGLLADGEFDVLEMQQFFFAYLKANGNPVSLDVLPGTTHDSMSDEAMPVFLAAFDRAAGER